MISALTSTSAAILPYTPLILAATATVAAIALIYFAVQHLRTQQASDTLLPQQPDSAKPPISIQESDLPPPPIKAVTPLSRFEERLSEVTSRTPQAQMGRVSTIFLEEIKKIQSSDEGMALIQAFITKGKETFPPQRISRFYTSLPTTFEDLWSNPHIEIGGLQQLLGQLGITNLPTICEAGTAQLKNDFEKASTFDEMHPLVTKLAQMGVDYSKKLTGQALRENKTTFMPANALCQQAIAVYFAMKTAAETERLNLLTLSQTMHRLGFRLEPTEDSPNPINTIKNKAGDEAKDTEIAAHIGSVENSYDELLKDETLGPPLKEMFIHLTLCIDDLFATSANFFDLSQPGEMDRLIEVTAWLNFISIAADMGPRKLQTNMKPTEIRDLLN